MHSQIYQEMKAVETNSGFPIGEQLILRAMEPSDLEFLYHLENNASQWQSSDNREPRSRYALKRYISQCCDDFLTRGELQLIIVNTETGESLGYVELFNLNLLNRRAEAGIMIAPQYQNQGIATVVLKTWIPQALRNFGLHKIVAYVDNSNTGSLKAFSNAGFISEAILKEWLWCDGEWRDVSVLTMNLETVGTAPER